MKIPPAKQARTEAERNYKFHVERGVERKLEEVRKRLENAVASGRTYFYLSLDEYGSQLRDDIAGGVTETLESRPYRYKCEILRDSSAITRHVRVTF